ncbi:unnamed protein product [Hydatigera taeniaeformis]|uniref:Uncharacterized protein n=1 Tax=Hydatigena taeniaeformis TaxID=6205 RepID=A0A0R3WJE1_HYDTA|nr:unnamed protein product [Hydatigera taeniaeformis]
MSDIWDIWNGSIYFATPKKRRSIEVRRARKFLSLSTSRLLVRCYDEVRRETNALRASLKSVREGLPHDNETQFLYDQENFGTSGAYIHRVDRKRPSWFPANLLGLSSSNSPSK